MSDLAYLSLEKVTLRYGDVIVVRNLDLSVGEGELLALLGPSGCGKTTTMRAIAGLMTPASGTIRLDGVDVTHIPANKRQVGLVFQSYALFPHLTTFDNVAFGLKLKGMRGAALTRKVEAGLRSVGLLDLAARKPLELSGGQQQRIALARSMVMEPKLLMLDEPLSNLDARLRLDIRAELRRVQKDTGVTMIFVTHDQAEALALADKIVVMRSGVVEQVGSPEDIYNHPVSRFVADFVGFENIFTVRDGQLYSDTGVIPLAVELPKGTGLAFRPGAVVLGAGPLSGSVRNVSFAGNVRDYVLETAFGLVRAEAAAGLPPYRPGEMVAFDLPVARAAILQRD
jgi:putative spermidine/putrescine transport system ATP-binding protein